jgi:Fe-S-cluster containining protein
VEALRRQDSELIQIIDAGVAEAARKSGAWLVCRPGCYQCCIGPFPISQLDAARLRAGLAALETIDPERAARVRDRAHKAAPEIHRPPASRSTDIAEFDAWVETLPDDAPCPALDPEAGTCDLYSARPLICRVFGPPVTLSGAPVAVCELCFQGATDDQIAACEVPLDIVEREAELSYEAGGPGQTLVAFALAEARRGE